MTKLELQNKTFIISAAADGVAVDDEAPATAAVASNNLSLFLAYFLY